jgi:hypothetical protein
MEIALRPAAPRIRVVETLTTEGPSFFAKAIKSGRLCAAALGAELLAACTGSTPE